MSLVIVLSAVVGAGLFFAGGCAGYWLEHRQAVRAPAKKARKSRPPKCYVIVPPGEPDEGPMKKKRKKRPVSGGAATVPFDERKIKGTDVFV